MKRPSGKLSFLALLLYLAACSKTDTSSNQNKSDDLTGRWNLVIDSTIAGAGISNHLAVYTGGAGDYFNFSNNGYVYTKEKTVLDTLTYKIVSDSSIIISKFGLIDNGVQDTSTITGLKANNALSLNVQTIFITSPRGITPGGEFWRKVILSR